MHFYAVFVKVVVLLTTKIIPFMIKTTLVARNTVRTTSATIELE